jgi:glutathione S-transferase
MRNPRLALTSLSDHFHAEGPAMQNRLTLISHALCPYVQRAAIVLMEKGVAFERVDVDLKCKPAWFLALSPLGKTPVLQVHSGEHSEALFESAVICEFLDETVAPPLHPAQPLQRARHRGWMEFGSSLLNAIGGFYSAGDEPVLAARAGEIRTRFEQLEHVLGVGPYFAGERFCLVDAVFGPIFRYFDVFDRIGDFGFFHGLPRLNAWRAQLSQRDSVRRAVGPDYATLLQAFLRERNSALSRRMP